MNRTTRETMDLIVRSVEPRGGMGGLFGFVGMAARLVLFVLNVVATFLFLVAARSSAAWHQGQGVPYRQRICTSLASWVAVR